MTHTETILLEKQPLEIYQTPTLTQHYVWQVATGVSFPVGTNALPESEGLQ